MPNLKKIDRRKPLEAFYCVVCGGLIDPKRVVQRAVTCSPEHAQILKLERRRLRNFTRCPFCNRPSTPADRAEFAAWRKVQAKEKGIRPGPKPKPKEGISLPVTPLESHLGTVTVS
jgi:predicted nucleic acid-binding Zn ribbon protein